MLNNKTITLLSRSDPDPVELINETSSASVVLVCEHAGRAIPERLGNLGLSEHVLHTHIGWDIGAEKVARCLADRLDAPLILQRYSRLVVDCNRPPEAQDFVPEISDGTQVPGNLGVAQEERDARVSEIFTPYNHALAKLLEQPSRKAAFSVHSFNPVLGGEFRPWEIGFLFRRDRHTSDTLRAYLSDELPELSIGMNEPYSIDDRSDWFVPRHAERLNLAHSLIEIRNDQIKTKEGQDRWVDLLANIITRLLKEL